MSVGNLAKRAYYSITDGKICRQFAEPTEFSKKRINKNGKEVNEEHYDYISGIITGITTKDSDFGRFWIITLRDDGNDFILQIPYSSSYSNAFLKTLPNIDLTKKVQFVPKMTIVEGGKKKSALFVNQGGVAIKWYFTKDVPNGIPEMKSKPGKGKDKGKTIWDDSEVMEFLEDYVNEHIIPKLPKVAAEDVKIDESAAAASQPEEGEDPPF